MRAEKRLIDTLKEKEEKFETKGIENKDPNILLGWTSHEFEELPDIVMDQNFESLQHGVEQKDMKIPGRRNCITA